MILVLGIFCIILFVVFFSIIWWILVLIFGFSFCCLYLFLIFCLVIFKELVYWWCLIVKFIKVKIKNKNKSEEMSYNVLFLNYNNWFCKFKRVVWFNFFKNKEKMKNFRKKVKKIFKVIKFLLRSFFKEKRFLMLLIGLILENLGLMILGVKS